MSDLEDALARAESYRQECHRLRGELQIAVTRAAILAQKLEAALRERDECRERLRDVLDPPKSG